MNNRIFIGLTAGIVAAVLYVTVGTGTLFALLLFYLAPLPLFIAGLGWGTLTTVIGSGVGGSVVAGISGFETGTLFMVTVAVPVVILTRMTLLSRTVSGNGADTVEWYPLGRLLIWISALSAALVCFAVILLGPDAAAFNAIIREWFEAILGTNQNLRIQLAPAGNSDLTPVIDFLVKALPPASAILWMLTTITNIWLASLIVERSGLAIRPRGEFSNIDLPKTAVIAFAVSIAGALASGLAGIVASSLSAVFTVCFALQGLAVVHVLTRTTQFRPAILGFTYIILFFGSWIGVLILCGIGLAEATFRLRDRFANRGGPPIPPHST